MLLLCMLFCHIVDDYYLQGFLASAKQKVWWEKNAPNPLYKNDYIMALAEHAFSWTFMVHIPLMLCFVLGIFGAETTVKIISFIILFVINVVIHVITDNAKANLLKINLVQDQMIHIVQIIVTWLVYVLFMK
jgi:hypothetical protein